MGKEKISTLFSVKVRIQSGKPHIKMRPSFKEGVVMAHSPSDAEKTACKILTQYLQIEYPSAYAEPFRVVKLKQDFVFDGQDL